jgi:hypothetical protein
MALALSSGTAGQLWKGINSYLKGSQGAEALERTAGQAASTKPGLFQGITNLLSRKAAPAVDTFLPSSTPTWRATEVVPIVRQVKLPTGRLPTVAPSPVVSVVKPVVPIPAIVQAKPTLPSLPNHLSPTQLNSHLHSLSAQTSKALAANTPEAEQLLLNNLKTLKAAEGSLPANLIERQKQFLAQAASQSQDPILKREGKKLLHELALNKASFQDVLAGLKPNATLADLRKAYEGL